MATSAQVSDPPLSLINEKTAADYETLTLENFVYHPAIAASTATTPPTTARGERWEKRKEEITVIPDSVDKEHMLRTFVEFKTIINGGRLNISRTYSKQGIFLRKILQGDLRIVFHNHVATAWVTGGNARDANSADEINDVIDAMILSVCGPRAYAIQNRYLHTTVKPFKLTCHQLYARLLTVAALMTSLPGAPARATGAGSVGPYTANDMKTMYYNMMLQSWKDEFDKSGQNLVAAGTSLDDIARYFTIQETIMNRGSRPNPRRTQPSNNRNQRGNRRDRPYNNNRFPPQRGGLPFNRPPMGLNPFRPIAPFPTGYPRPYQPTRVYPPPNPMGRPPFPPPRPNVGFDRRPDGRGSLGNRGGRGNGNGRGNAGGRGDAHHYGSRCTNRRSEVHYLDDLNFPEVNEQDQDMDLYYQEPGEAFHAVGGNESHANFDDQFDQQEGQYDEHFDSNEPSDMHYSEYDDQSEQY